MKKHILSFVSVLAIGSLVFFACKKKDDDTLKPTYKEEASGTASNPQPNNVTVTGAPTSTTPPTQNSSIVLGGAGWSNPSCLSTNSLQLIANNGDCQVTLTFAAPPPAGTSTYNIASTPGINAAAMKVVKAPEQPEGVTWFGRSGTVLVSNTNSVINASIQNPGVSCVQSNFQFPEVRVYGVLGCN